MGRIDRQSHGPAPKRWWVVHGGIVLCLVWLACWRQPEAGAHHEYQLFWAVSGSVKEAAGSTNRYVFQHGSALCVQFSAELLESFLGSAAEMSSCAGRVAEEIGHRILLRESGAVRTNGTDVSTYGLSWESSSCSPDDPLRMGQPTAVLPFGRIHCEHVFQSSAGSWSEPVVVRPSLEFPVRLVPLPVGGKQ
jgi:hypothetical protein